LTTLIARDFVYKIQLFYFVKQKQIVKLENCTNKKLAEGTASQCPKHQRMEAASAGNGTLIVSEKW
jgi:hypothetical protein